MCLRSEENLCDTTDFNPLVVAYVVFHADATLTKNTVWLTNIFYDFL